jgi:non-haem Fe2+, alpha-ketoglutarate-dependent halogenase
MGWYTMIHDSSHPHPTAKLPSSAVISDQLRAGADRFVADGFLGPIRLYEPQTADEMLREIRIENQDRRHILYDNPVNYDRHFDIRPLARHISHPVVVEHLKAVLGPDVLLWRTEFFPKFPGGDGTEWHQVRDYSYANGRPQLLPTDSAWNAFIDITVWTTFTPATKDTGCLKFVRGSHKKWYFDETKATGRGRNAEYDVNSAATGFFGYDFSDFKIDPNWEPAPEDVVELEMAPGEAVIFTANCVHGSRPNTTKRETRYAIAGRYVPTHVKIYPEQDEFMAHGATFDLSRYGAVLVAGRNDFSHNRIRPVDNHGEPFLSGSPA